jgi:streptomycin 6-kinase
VEGINSEDNGMGEDMMVEVKVVEREREGVVLARHWTGNGATMSRRACRE